MIYRSVVFCVMLFGFGCRSPLVAFVPQWDHAFSRRPSTVLTDSTDVQLHQKGFVRLGWVFYQSDKGGFDEAKPKLLARASAAGGERVQLVYSNAVDWTRLHEETVCGVKQNYDEYVPPISLDCGPVWATSDHRRVTLLGIVWRADPERARAEPVPAASPAGVQLRQTLTKFEAACQTGTRSACTALGEIYRFGRGLKPDPVRAMGYLGPTCRAGSRSACRHAVWTYEAFEGRFDRAEAIEFARRGCQEKSGQLCFKRDRLKHPSEKSPAVLQARAKEAARVGKQACWGGDVTECDWLGERLFYGGLGFVRARTEGEKLRAEARRLRESLCREGNVEACTRLVGPLGRRSGAPESRTLQYWTWAFEASTRRCQEGLVEGCVALGHLYLKKGPHQDEAQSAGYFERACTAGSSGACYALGRAFYGGKGRAQDRGKTKSLWARACQGGYEDGCYGLYRLLRE